MDSVTFSFGHVITLLRPASAESDRIVMNS
jgi:hypothetical protein